MLPAICFNLDQSKILPPGNGLIKEIMEKGENPTGSKHYLPLQQCFLYFPHLNI